MEQRPAYSAGKCSLGPMDSNHATGGSLGQVRHELSEREIEIIEFRHDIFYFVKKTINSFNVVGWLLKFK